MAIELSLKGVVWGLANGEVRIPAHGEDDAIARFLETARAIAAEQATTPGAAYLRFEVDSGLLVVSGVTVGARPLVEAIVTTAAARTP